MRKKQIGLILVIGLALMFSSCMSAIPDMSEEDEARVTQYMADLLLENDANYKSSYLDEAKKQQALVKEEEMRLKAEQIKKEEEAIKQKKEEANKPDEVEVSESTNNFDGEVDSLHEYLGFEGVSFAYDGYQICSRYPDEEEVVTFAMTPSEGNEFVILNFTVINNTADSCFLDVGAQSGYFTLCINESLQRRALTTLLETDLSIYYDAIEANAQENVVLVFEKPLDVEVESLTLEVTSVPRDVYKKVPLE